MSSGTVSNPPAARQLANAMGSELDQNAAAMGGPAPMSPRQQELDHYWRYYSCTTYDGRRLDWSGQENLPKVEHEQVAQAGFIPPGFYDAGQTMPLKFRRPTAPYYLGRVVVDRFTSLLFSHRRTPKVVVEGDPDTQDWLDGAIQAGRLWPTMIQARTFGGAMGAVGLGFKIVDGAPVFEAHDPRWCHPEFEDRHSGTLASLEIRYSYPDHIRGPKGEPIQAWFWYRRLIDAERDEVWPKVPVGDGAEPVWEEYRSRAVEHGLGFCPAVWIQNLPVDGDVDGDPDAHGGFDIIEAIDALIAQAHKGTLSNCDPTTVLATDAEMDEVRKGSDNAIKLEAGGTASYMEINGQGPRTAMELVEVLEQKFLRLVRCYLDSNKDGPAKTMMEIERNYSAMLEKTDLLREQYGERGVKPILTMLLRAARKLAGAKIERAADGTPRIVRETINLPPKVLQEGADGRAVFVPRKLGPSSLVALQWPPYFTPSLDDIVKAVQAAGIARAAQLLDDEHAIAFIAPYFQIADTRAMLDKIRAAAETANAQVEQQMMDRFAARMTPNLKMPRT